jgi:hypothetical protein
VHPRSMSSITATAAGCKCGGSRCVDGSPRLRQQSGAWPQLTAAVQQGRQQQHKGDSSLMYVVQVLQQRQQQVTNAPPPPPV